MTAGLARETGPVASRIRLDRPRPAHRPGSVISAVAIVLVCAALAGIVALRADQRTAVLAIARRVPAGQAITDTDLQVVRANSGGLPAIPASQRSRVVGRFAAVDLVAGTLLVPGALTDSGTPGPGEAVIAVVLRPEQVPAGGLVPGDRLRLVATGGGGDDGPAAGSVVAANARVFTVTRRTTPGQEAISISVVVSEAELPAVARAAATGRITVALLTRAIPGGVP